MTAAIRCSIWRFRSSHGRWSELVLQAELRPRIMLGSNRTVLTGSSAALFIQR